MMSAVTMFSAPRMVLPLRRLILFIVLLASIPLPLTNAQSKSIPKILDAEWTLQLVVTDPQLVTPIACRFDADGRLYVVESHTHFPPQDYAGPKTDRIYVFDQFQEAGDRVNSRQRLFYEGGATTMGLASLPDGWLAVSTRSGVQKIRDNDGDGVAEQQVPLLKMETEANYPHNGLSGLLLSGDGWLYVGQGENLGASYRLVGTDGSVQAGGGEGGNIFRCRMDGSQVERVATGFWNPFGLYLDPAQRLWAVENDPDSRPPCRLLQVATGGDYGFQFQFGRAGTHPLLAWNGELPGTLPMVSGTGEAPCAVVGFDDAMWVTSWGSNRIERYRLQHTESGWKANMDVVLQGDAFFRPVDFAIAPDGSLYFTDWVDRSYNVHRQGRLWRLSKRSKPASMMSSLSANETDRRIQTLQSDSKTDPATRLAAFDDKDPFVRQAAVTGLVNSKQLSEIRWESATSANQQVGILNAWHWLDLTNSAAITPTDRLVWIHKGLESPFDDVRTFAVRWAAERQEKELLPQLRMLLTDANISPQQFGIIIGAVAFIEKGSAASGPRDPAREELLSRFAADESYSIPLRTLALRWLPAAAEVPTDEQLGQWLTTNTDRGFSREIVRLLAERNNQKSSQMLVQAAGSSTLPEETRADALAALDRQNELNRELIQRVANGDYPQVVKLEASRLLQNTPQAETDRPRADDLAAWMARVAEPGSVDAGRRVFFRTTCAKCHAHAGRGSRIGPDLTNISGHMNRERLLESILQPSREIAPLFVPWTVSTTEGKTLSGIRLERTGASDKMCFLGSDGIEFDVPLSQIEDVSVSSKSIMPDDLATTMTRDEFRDLLTFLLYPEKP